MICTREIPQPLKYKRVVILFVFYLDHGLPQMFEHLKYSYQPDFRHLCIQTGDPEGLFFFHFLLVIFDTLHVLPDTLHPGIHNLNLFLHLVTELAFVLQNFDSIIQPFLIVLQFFSCIPRFDLQKVRRRRFTCFVHEF